jgi:hypothetical protein
MSLTDLIAHAAAWNVAGGRVTATEARAAVAGPLFDAAAFTRWDARPAERAVRVA